MDIILEGMALQISKNLLRDACGRKITCDCGSILDARKAVLVTTKVAAGISCAKCFDSMVERIQAKHPDIDVLEGIEVDDGRKLFK